MVSSFTNDGVTPPAPELDVKWSGPRVVRTEANPYIDPGIDFSGDPGRTDQSQASDADVNIIMKRYLQTGVLPSVSGTPLYDDFSDTVDYHEAMNIVIRAQQQFDGLDAFVRARFQNDPAQFLEFVSDPKNAQEMISLGIASERPQSDTDRIVEAVRASGKKSKPNPSPADPVSDD